MRRVRDLSSWGVVALFLAGMSGVGVSMLIDKYLSRPPVKIVSAVPVSETVVSGEPAKIRYTLDRNRTCPAEVSPVWVRGDDIVRLPIYPAGASRIGTQTVEIRAPTAGRDAVGEAFRLSAGEWIYTTTSRHWCGDQTITMTSPLVRVQIVTQR